MHPSPRTWTIGVQRPVTFAALIRENAVPNPHTSGTYHGEPGTIRPEARTGRQGVVLVDGSSDGDDDGGLRARSGKGKSADTPRPGATHHAVVRGSRANQRGTGSCLCAERGVRRQRSFRLRRHPDLRIHGLGLTLLAKGLGTGGGREQTRPGGSYDDQDLGATARCAA